MGKLRILGVFIVLYGCVFLLAGCGLLQDSSVLPKGSSTGISVISSGSKHTWVKITGTVTPTEKEYAQMMQAIADLPVQERKYSFFDEKGDHTSLVASFGSKTSTFKITTFETGTVLQEIQNDVVVWQNGGKTDIIGQLLGFDKKIVGIYGPFKKHTPPQYFAIYTVASPYGDGIREQYLLDLETKKSFPSSPFLFLYYKGNDLYATQLLQNDVHLYSGLLLFTQSGMRVLVTGKFDSFTFDGYHLFLSRITQTTATADYLEVTIFDTTSQEILAVAESLPIGRDAMFLLQRSDDSLLLTAFYGVPDFTNETTSMRALRYDLKKRLIVWEIAIN